MSQASYDSRFFRNLDSEILDTVHNRGCDCWAILKEGHISTDPYNVGIANRNLVIASHGVYESVYAGPFELEDR
jgi:hypothetical protein